MKNFAITPSVNISRSKFDRVSTHKTSAFLGDIVPIYLDEVLPGDTRSIDYGALIRMSTPIAPIMDDIDYELFAFFVPMRLTWDNWKEFMGENKTGAGFLVNSKTIPQTDTYIKMPASSYDDIKFKHCVGSYLGLPPITLKTSGSPTPTSYSVSELPLRAYHLICNRWFRNQNVEAPVNVLLGDDRNYEILYSDRCRVASKKPDYFTKALPYAQKGEPVLLPLGVSAPIVAETNYSNPTEPAIFANKGGLTLNGNLVLNAVGNSADLNTNANLTSANIFADLSQATAANINQLREAWQLQKALEKDALYGTRYWEILYGHFGVRSPDSTLQDPEFLGGARIKINIEQVLQTTGYVNDDTSALASIGANSVSGNKGNLFTKSFVEHGYIMIMAVARHRETYGQGINKLFTRKGRFDFYWPVFANLGAQPVYESELYFDGSKNPSTDIFGYQEAWAEYRYKPNIVSGELNPAFDTSLDFWTLASKFDEAPTLSTSFTKVNRNSLARALTTGANGPDFMCDFFFKDTAVRPMPLYSIPGLVDHH